jgi:hypothetical protein
LGITIYLPGPTLSTPPRSGIVTLLPASLKSAAETRKVDPIDTCLNIAFAFIPLISTLSHSAILLVEIPIASVTDRLVAVNTPADTLLNVEIPLFANTFPTRSPKRVPVTLD